MITAVAPRRGFSEPQRVHILDGALCWYCGAFDPSQVDHVMPFARGGSDNADNLVAACARCNLDKSDMTLDEWELDRRARGASWPPPAWNDTLWEVITTVPTPYVAAIAARLDSGNPLPGSVFDYLDEVHKRGPSVESLAHAVGCLVQYGAAA
jgi:hypothetical protein